MVYAFNIPQVIRSALEKRRYIVYETVEEDDDDFFDPEPPRPETTDSSDILSDEVQRRMEEFSMRGLENHERTRAKFRDRVRFMREWEGTEEEGRTVSRAEPPREEAVSPEGIPMMGNVQGEELARKQRDFLKQRQQAENGPELPKDVAENPVARYFVRERMRQRGYSSDRS